MRSTRTIIHVVDDVDNISLFLILTKVPDFFEINANFTSARFATVAGSSAVNTLLALGYLLNFT